VLANATRFLRFCEAASTVVAHPTTPERARQFITRLNETREENLLAVVDRIVEEPGGPYARLLAHAGVERADVARLVAEDGVEGALGRLYEAGIYTTTAELKGDVPIRRGSLELDVSHEDFDSKRVGGIAVLRSGGSTGNARPQVLNLAGTLHGGAHVRLFSDAFGVRGRPMALWYPSPPGVAGLGNALEHLHAGWRIERWFAQTPWFQRGLAVSAATSLGAFAVSHARRRPLPFPRHVPPVDAQRVAEWLVRKKQAGTPPYLAATPSSAVRVCQAAAAAGLDISGTFFRTGGEPLTPAKAETMRAAGGRPISFYYAAEATGLVSVPCPEGSAPDDGHLTTEKLGLLVRRRTLENGSEADALLMTTLLPGARKLILNWESGDTGVVDTRSCGCPLGELGFHLRIHSIRSYEKLTSEGMTFADGALVALVEEVLPRRFGGLPTDYQVVEQEVDGATRLRLRVSPAVGALDEAAVVEEALAYLGGRSGAERAMAAVWRGAGTLEVVRAEPHMTAASKTPSLYRAPASG